MKIEEAKDILENVVADEVVGIYCKEIQKETDCSKNCEKEDCFIQQAIDTVIAELHALQNLLDEKNEEIEHLQKENEELKAKQVMQEFKIDWCEKNTIKKCEIKAIFSTYEARREQGEAVIGYWVLKDFVKKLLGEK